MTEQMQDHATTDRLLQPERQGRGVAVRDLMIATAPRLDDELGAIGIPEHLVTQCHAPGVVGAIAQRRRKRANTARSEGDSGAPQRAAGQGVTRGGREVVLAPERIGVQQVVGVVRCERPLCEVELAVI